MPILNMIAQGSGGGGGGSNVGEPSNLSASATSATSVDIKWTDNGLQALPPSTFGKSVLVRKVGSAPTTPSDGTTVVTETVMNTYQSSAYSDTGLTQGTTYYYQVFSYSTDGGITYGTPVSATPQGGWQPGADTIAYYPFKGDVENKVDGALATLGSGSSIGSDYATLDASLITCPLSESFGVSGTAFTYSVWTNQYMSSGTSIGNNPRIINYNNTPFYLIIKGDTSKVIINWRPDENANYTGPINGIGTWNNIIIAYPGSGTDVYVYINGVKYTYPNGLENRSAYSDLILGDTGANDAAHFYISEMILETKQWTDQEAQDYYDSTKGDYGIS